MVFLVEPNSKYSAFSFVRVSNVRRRVRPTLSGTSIFDEPAELSNGMTNKEPRAKETNVSWIFLNCDAFILLQCLEFLSNCERLSIRYCKIDRSTISIHCYMPMMIWRPIETAFGFIDKKYLMLSSDLIMNRKQNQSTKLLQPYSNNEFFEIIHQTRMLHIRRHLRSVQENEINSIQMLYIRLIARQKKK